MFPRALIGACLAVLLIAGCASRPIVLNPGHPYGTDLDASGSWHQVRLRWRWPDQQPPRWSLDLLAADRIMAGIITEHHESLPLWRFHRRAARDAAGHQFSFLFYSSDAVAGRIREAVVDHPLTARLTDQEWLERVFMTAPDEATELFATSDPAWPGELQSTWPMFIMGVSQTWLGLIEARAGNRRLPEGDLEQTLRYYDEVDDALGEVWAEYAQHAFFHHLSGIFGYQPLVIRNRMRF